MLRNARFIVGLCALAGVSVAGVIAWVTGFFSRLAVGVADVWDWLLAFEGLSLGDLLASVGAGAAMLAIILVVIMAITNH